MYSSSDKSRRQDVDSEFNKQNKIAQDLGRFDNKEQGQRLSENNKQKILDAQKSMRQIINFKLKENQKYHRRYGDGIEY